MWAGIRPYALYHNGLMDEYEESREPRKDAKYNTNDCGCDLLVPPRGR
jgi:hypothetical protein